MNPFRDRVQHRGDLLFVIAGVAVAIALVLWARAARAELASSQSGSLVRRTNELCASHSAVHDVHVSRYEPPE